MAPSASMLFLSYPKLHNSPAEAPHKDASGAGTGTGGGFRFGLSNVFFSLPKRRDAAPVSDGGKQGARGARGEEGEESARLAGKFDEAVRLSCWAS